MSEFEDTINNILSLLEEKKRRLPKRAVTKRSAVSRSQLNRKKRAREVKIFDYKKQMIGGGQKTRHTCKATSAEKSESDVHDCRIDTINKTKEITDMACSCSDFQSRFRYFRNEEGVARWNTVKPIKDVFEPHTREFPKIMNPDRKGYACKHLLAFMKVLKLDNKKRR